LVENLGLFLAHLLIALKQNLQQKGFIGLVHAAEKK
jgi:hypothetical protein